jgi:predicted nuclease with TOPRIM domain
MSKLTPTSLDQSPKMTQEILDHQARLEQQDAPARVAAYKRMNKGDKIAFLELRVAAQKGLIHCWTNLFLTLDKEDNEKIIALTQERDELKEACMALTGQIGLLAHKVEELSNRIEADAKLVPQLMQQLELSNLALTGMMEMAHVAERAPDVFMSALDQG